jgi:iron complex outermembrane receptor protein
MLNSSYKSLEVGMAYYDKASGYGSNYAFDKNNPRGWWREPDIEAYAKNTVELSDMVTSSTMMRFRRSDVTNDNVSMEGYDGGPFVDVVDADGNPVLDDAGNATQERTSGRHILLQYWQSLNSSWYVQQDFDIVPSDDLVIKTGINFEDRDIQKAYDLPSAPRVAAADFTAADAGPTPIGAPSFENRLRWVNMGAFAQLRYDIGQFFDSADHLVNAGVRYHNNSLYGSSVTLRGGYVGDLDFINLKILGGQSFQEPSPKQLFGSWAGSGTNSALLPEKSTTLETVVDWASESVSVTLNPYFVQVTDLITEAGGSPSNVGSRTIAGADVFIRGKMSLGSVGTLRGWFNYGFSDAQEQESDDADTTVVGDIAPQKINFGLTTVMMDGDVTLNLRGRYVGERETAPSNPVPTIPAFFTADANLMARNIMADGIGLSLRVNNITDAAYSHPGIRAANAGNTEGGSGGWSSSMLPQPGRSFMASLHLDI